MRLFVPDKKQHGSTCQRNIIGTHELKHKLLPTPMSKDELSIEMGMLVKSTHLSNSDGFTICYDDAEVKIPFICSKCGRRRLLTNEDPDIIEKYERLAQNFTKLGYKAKISTYCNDCILENTKRFSQIVFSFQAAGMEEPVKSFPNCHWYEEENYLLALDFLKGASSAKVLSDLHGISKEDSKLIIERINPIIGTSDELFSAIDDELPF